MAGNNTPLKNYLQVIPMIKKEVTYRVRNTD